MTVIKLPDFLTQIALNMNFTAAAFILIILCWVFSAVSLIFNTLVYGYPKNHISLLVFNLLSPLILYAFAIIKISSGGFIIGGNMGAFVYLVFLNVAITGLYAGLSAYLMKVSQKYDPYFAVTCTNKIKIATIKEEQLFCKKTESIKTHKLGSKKRRLDDDVNFHKAETIINTLKLKNLSPVDSASLLLWERQIKSFKNLIITDDIRSKLCDAFLSVVKIQSRYSDG